MSSLHSPITVSQIYCITTTIGVMFANNYSAVAANGGAVTNTVIDVGSLDLKMLYWLCLSPNVANKYLGVN